MKARFCRGLSMLLLLKNTMYRLCRMYRDERDRRSTSKRSTFKLTLIPPGDVGTG